MFPRLQSDRLDLLALYQKMLVNPAKLSQSFTLSRAVEEWTAIVHREQPVAV